MAETTKKGKSQGFRHGLQQVYHTRPAADYARCLAEVREVCMSTEDHGVSRSTYYNKMYGRAPLTAAEVTRLNDVFAKYGVIDWRGNE